MFDIEEELKKLPDSPGVYMHKDSLGQVIYVGKAISLRRRVRQYFRQTSRLDPKVRAMVSNIAEFDYITCATEMEALILECNLIKKYMPKYNILMKDDKTYPYIEVTTAEKYPRVIRTRKIERDGNRYFGPYSDSGAVRKIIRLIGEMYPTKKCQTIKFQNGVRPCLNYFIGRCGGMCIDAVNDEEYGEMIRDILAILGGRDYELKRELQKKMNAESEALRYEEAAKYRDYITALKTLDETQRATMISDRDIDILIPLVTARNKIVLQYKVRDGKLTGREILYMDDQGGAGQEELIPAFIKQYYTEGSPIPREILLAGHVDDEELLAELLNRENESNAEAKIDLFHKTRLTVPERGDKKAVLDLAVTDSIELVKSLDERAERDNEKKAALRKRITAVIEYACRIDGAVPYTLSEDDEREYRIEAYDISNMNGIDTVGAMVVYEGRIAIRNDYRKFRIRTAASGDDYAALQEVVYRRFKRAKSGDKGFSIYPDVMFIDGGLGQVHAVKTVIDAFGMSIPVVGLAKDDAHRTRAIVFDDAHEIDLKDDKILFSYAGTIQEEVHRFAITFQRGVRGTKMTLSGLEKIPGIGPKRREELLRHFRSVDAVRTATYDQLLEVSGMNGRAAENVIEYFKKRK